MMLEGVKVTQEDHDFRSFRAGEQVILLLTRDKRNGNCSLPSSTASAFYVDQESRVRPFVVGLETAPMFATFRGLTVSQFEAELRRLTR